MLTRYEYVIVRFSCYNGKVMFERLKTVQKDDGAPIILIQHLDIVKYVIKVTELLA